LTKNLRIKIFAENIFAQKSEISNKTTFFASQKGHFVVKSLIFERILRKSPIFEQIFLSANFFSFTVLGDKKHLYFFLR
jgi:hypothetical protein